MKDFFDYFFGAGTDVEFTNFTLAHALPILVAAALIYGIYRFREPLRGWRHAYCVLCTGVCADHTYGHYLHRPYPVPLLSVLGGTHPGLYCHLLYDLCAQDAPDSEIRYQILHRACRAGVSALVSDGSESKKAVSAK